MTQVSQAVQTLSRLMNPFGTVADRAAGALEGRSSKEIFIEHYHSMLGHQSDRILRHYMRQHYWWPEMVKEIEAYCRTCASCQASKPERAAPRGKLHPIQLPFTAYEEISIDFTGPHPVSIDADGIARLHFHRD
jgi:hypothetical protein